MKTILLHIHDDQGQDARLQVALDIARAHKGHLTCLQPTVQFKPMPYAPIAGQYVADLGIGDMLDLERAHRQKIEARLQSEDIPWDWRMGMGDPATLLVEQSGLTDLLVVSQSLAKDHEENSPLHIPGEVAVHAHAATLVVPTECNSFDSGKPIVAAWNGSKESSRAIRFSLQMLAKASEVHILVIEKQNETVGSDAATYLSRHGISAVLHKIDQGKRKDSEVIEEFALDKNASAIVMGAYGHSRLRETLMGGVTKDQLSKSKLPLIMGH